MADLTGDAMATDATWLPLQALIGTTAIAELALALACFSVTTMLVSIAKIRISPRSGQFCVALGVCIFLSGASNLSQLSTGPSSNAISLGIDICAAIECIGAALLVRHLLRTGDGPSRLQLQGVITRLEIELRDRSNVLDALREAHATLEARVQETTTDLYNRNQQLYSEIIEHNRVEAALRETQLVLDSAHRMALSNAGFDRHKISADLLALLAENHPFPTSAMLLEDRRTGNFRCIAWHGMPNDGMSSFNFPQGVLGQVAESGRITTLACHDFTGSQAAGDAQTDALVEALIVPVMYEGNCMSILVLAGTKRFEPKEVAFVESLRFQLGVAQHNLRLYVDSKRLASELHTRNIEIAQKNLQLEDVSRTKSEFVANMSHELCTPLNAVLGFTGTLLMRLPGPLTSDQDKQLRTIQSSARHLLSLINDLLDVEKIESGKLELQLQRVVLQSVIREVFETLQPQAAQKGLEFRMSLPQANITLYTDRRALSQILLNLLNNAIKFTESGHVAVRLSRRRTGEFGTVEMIVTDTGIGIPLEHQAQMFQAFTQLDSGSNRRFDGTGLGLYLSRRLAVMIGGQLHCKSVHGKGSVFTLALPGRR